MPSSHRQRSGCPIHRALVLRDEWVFATRTVLALLCLLPAINAQLPREPSTIRIGVLSLFFPRTLTLTVDHPITLFLDGNLRILDVRHPATLTSTRTALHVDETEIHILTIPTETFTLTVPNKLTRTYRGALTVTSRNGVLIPVVTMDTELAVASIVAAESPPGAPLEALKAQAIASRSYVLANPPAHRDFDSCDTTHCQFLRSPPASDSPAALATQATRNVVLTWRPSAESPRRLVAARYSRTCGGQTRTLLSSSPATYPFYSVRCDFCRRHPELQSATHRIGLCQLGAADLARRGRTYTEILGLYYPNTMLSTLP